MVVTVDLLVGHTVFLFLRLTGALPTALADI